MAEHTPTADDDLEPELTEEELEHFKARLHEERAKVLAKLRRHAGDALPDAEPVAEEGDLATQISNQAFNLKLADKDRKLLGEIDRALGKFAEDDYGICEGTGDPINKKRLELRPWTRYSVEYKELLEKQRGKQHR